MFLRTGEAVYYHSGMPNMPFRNNHRFGPKMLQKLSQEG